MMSARDLTILVRAGARVRVEASDYSILELTDLARTGSEGRGGLDIRNAKVLSIAECSHIAEAAPGLVTFEF